MAFHPLTFAHRNKKPLLIAGVAITLILSVSLNVVFLYLRTATNRRSVVAAGEAVTVAAQPSAAPAKNTLLMPNDESRQTEQPKEKTFESNANLITASQMPPTGSLPLPSQKEPVVPEQEPAVPEHEPVVDTKGIKVTLPVAQSGEIQSEPDYISVSVDRNGNPYFDKTEMNYDQLTATLQKVHDENPEAKVFIRGDADTVHGNIIRVLDILRSVGFYTVAFEIRSEAAKTFPAPEPIKAIRIALPSATAPLPSQAKDYVAIQVREGNAVYLDGQYVSDDQVLPRLHALHQANPDIKVSISATMFALHGDVIAVLDKVRRVDITKVGYQIETFNSRGSKDEAGELNKPAAANQLPPSPPKVVPSPTPPAPSGADVGPVATPPPANASLGAKSSTPNASKVSGWSTDRLMKRRTELVQRFKDDSFGIYFGVMRWVSHAIDKGKAKEEFRAISNELNRRGIQVSTEIPKKED